MIVKNQFNVAIDFNAAINLMDDELREQIHAKCIDSEQAFFDEYAEAHRTKYGEPWELDKPNPVY